MQLTNQQTRLLSELLRTTTNQAVEQAQHSRNNAEHKADGSWITATDHQIQQELSSALGEHFPAVDFMGEEMEEQEQQQLWQRCCEQNQPLWVVDPLDGTSNFRAGFPVYATTLCLLKGGRAIYGAVYDPVRNELFHAQRGQGAFLNQQALHLDNNRDKHLKQALAAVDFKRLPEQLASTLATRPPFASQRSIGSVALDWCWLAAGRVQVYLHGKQKLWDYAAAQLILQEAGGCSADLTGQTDTEDAVLNFTPRAAVAATSPALLKQWQDAIADASQPER